MLFNLVIASSIDVLCTAAYFVFMATFSLFDNYLNLPQEMLYIHPYKKLYKTVSTRYFIIFVKHIDKQATYCFRPQILLLFDIV